jgi:hypothetical protein
LYSRRSLFRQGLLRKFTLGAGLRFLRRALGWKGKSKDSWNRSS